MRAKLEHLIADLVPPIVLRGVRTALAPRRGTVRLAEQAGEKGADWYDASFDASEDWSRHYTESEYYFLWSVIADRIQGAGVKSILEIGCGTGQLASLMRDKVGCKYMGFDFSQKRVEYARNTNPGLSFVQQDAFKTDLFTTQDYDTVICTEFLEHVEGDMAVLARIQKGSRFYGTVPNFPFVSHVRYFIDESQVRSRYGSCFQDLRVDRFPANAEGKTFYLLDGEVR